MHLRRCEGGRVGTRRFTVVNARYARPPGRPWPRVHKSERRPTAHRSTPGGLRTWDGGAPPWTGHRPLSGVELPVRNASGEQASGKDVLSTLKPGGRHTQWWAAPQAGGSEGVLRGTASNAS